VSYYQLAITIEYDYLPTNNKAYCIITVGIKLDGGGGIDVVELGWAIPYKYSITAVVIITIAIVVCNSSHEDSFECFYLKLIFFCFFFFIITFSREVTYECYRTFVLDVLPIFIFWRRFVCTHTRQNSTRILNYLYNILGKSHLRGTINKTLKRHDNKNIKIL